METSLIKKNVKVDSFGVVDKRGQNQKNRNKATVFTLKDYYILGDVEKSELLNRFRKEYREQRTTWGSSLSRKYVSESMKISKDLVGLLCSKVDVLEHLERKEVPMKFVSRSAFDKLSQEIREGIENKIKDGVIRVSLENRKMRLREAEKIVSLELRMSIALVRSISPSFETIQKKRKVY